MGNEAVVQLVMWIGVIMIVPVCYRFCYAASSLLWRRLFPTRIFEFKFSDESTGSKKSLTLKLPRKNSELLVNLIDEAIKEESNRK